MIAVIVFKTAIMATMTSLFSDDDDDAVNY